MVNNIFRLLILESFWFQNVLLVDYYTTYWLAWSLLFSGYKVGFFNAILHQCLFSFFLGLIFWFFEPLSILLTALVIVNSDLWYYPNRKIFYWSVYFGVESKIVIASRKYEFHKYKPNGVKTRLFHALIGWPLINWPWLVK